MGGAPDLDEVIDPRVERSRRVIRQAALAEFGDKGYAACTIEAIAARAGVGRATVYRHWDTKLALIADALEALNEQPSRNTTTVESPRARVEQLLRHLIGALTDSALSACVAALVEAAEHDLTVRAFHHRYSADRRQALVDAIADAIKSGDFSPTTDPELAALALAGTLFYCRLITDEPFDPQRVCDLVDLVLGPVRRR